MKPSLNHQYPVADLILDNVIVVLLKSFEWYLTNEDVTHPSKINLLYQEMVHHVVKLRTLDFSKLWEPRIGYLEQTAIQSSCVDMATGCAIQYSLHPGMVIRYSTSRANTIGKNRNVT
jgi:hypothetical protein